MEEAVEREPAGRDGAPRSRTARAVRATGGAVGLLVRWTARLAVVAAFLAAGLAIGGFLRFTAAVHEHNEAATVPPGRADAVVALTGGAARIAHGLALLDAQAGRRLLISGVGQNTTAEALSARNRPYAALFACCVDVEAVSVDTVSNARETAAWAKERGFSSLLLVTSAYHMPRSLTEFARGMPDTRLVPAPVAYPELAQEDWWRQPDTLRLMLGEYIKYMGASLRGLLGSEGLEAVRATLFSRSGQEDRPQDGSSG